MQWAAGRAANKLPSLETHAFGCTPNSLSGCSQLREPRDCELGGILDGLI
jgi:hypothetical protein